MAPSELPTTTAGRCLLISQKDSLAIERKLNRSKDGMFRSGAMIRTPSGARSSPSAAIFLPRGDEAKP